MAEARRKARRLNRLVQDFFDDGEKSAGPVAEDISRVDVDIDEYREQDEYSTISSCSSSESISEIGIQGDMSYDSPTTQTTPFSGKLAEWFSGSGCSRESLNELLAILRISDEHSDLPKDARTLLNTPRHVEAVSRFGGQYLYVGITKGMKHQVDLLKNADSFELTVNIDGLPLSKSSNSQL